MQQSAGVSVDTVHVAVVRRFVGFQFASTHHGRDPAKGPEEEVEVRTESGEGPGNSAQHRPVTLVLISSYYGSICELGDKTTVPAKRLPALPWVPG